MTEFKIGTPRGVSLSATVLEPVRPTETAVIFAHDFLADRHQSKQFDALAAAYRAAGHVTVQFDFSGCGTSDDGVITLQNQVEDLQAVASWTAEFGWRTQVVHAAGFGAAVALKAYPPRVVAMVLTDPLTGPMTYPWEEIFSEKQLSELATVGITHVLDDSPNARGTFTISKQTLADLSMLDQHSLLSDAEVPVLLVHGGEGELLTMSQEGFHLLRDGSRLEVIPVPEGRLLRPNTELAQVATDWVSLRLR